MSYASGHVTLMAEAVPSGKHQKGGFGFAFLGSETNRNRSLVAALHVGFFAILGGDASGNHR
jgi:hypothetical protein